MLSIFLSFLNLHVVFSLDIYVSLLHASKCSIQENGCFGDKSKPFSDISDGFLYAKSLSERWQESYGVNLNFFLQSNKAEKPYLIYKEINDPLSLIPGKSTNIYIYFIFFFIQKRKKIRVEKINKFHK